MKLESKFRIACLALMLFVVVHYFYNVYYLKVDIPHEIFLLGSWAPLLILLSLLKGKRNQDPDFSQFFNVLGVLIAVISYLTYFVYISGILAGIWSNDIVEDLFFICFIFIFLYYIFLMWYKRLW